MKWNTLYANWKTNIFFLKKSQSEIVGNKEQWWQEVGEVEACLWEPGAFIGLDQVLFRAGDLCHHPG